MDKPALAGCQYLIKLVAEPAGDGRTTAVSRSALNVLSATLSSGTARYQTANCLVSPSVYRQVVPLSLMRFRRQVSCECLSLRHAI